MAAEMDVPWRGKFMRRSNGEMRVLSISIAIDDDPHVRSGL